MPYQENTTDITFELFNYCNGSCSGCMLNARERSTVNLAAPVSDIKKGLNKLKEYGDETNTLYRVVFSFGDVPKLKWEALKDILQHTVDIGLKFGLTLTCVDPNHDYEDIINKVLAIDDDVIFDITIDPIRLISQKVKDKYIANLKMAISKAPECHLQVLLSNPLMKQFSPQDLADILLTVTKKPVFLGFSPTIENLESKDRYGYPLATAYDYAKSFYNTSESKQKFLQVELERFNNFGEYKHFTAQTFHIDSLLNVYPIAYSIYGDIIQDKRNNLKALGNLHTTSLKDIVQNDEALYDINIANNMEILNSPFNCESCEYFEACTFVGIGVIRKIYKGFEQRAGSCYGPIHLKNFIQEN